MALFGGSRRRRHRKSGMRKRGGNVTLSGALGSPDISKITRKVGLSGGSKRRRRGSRRR